MKKIGQVVTGIITFLTTTYISLSYALALPTVGTTGTGSQIPSNTGGYVGASQGTSGVENLVIDILKYVLGISGLIAVVFLVIGGISYITAGGNEETTKKATRTLLNAVIGMIIVFAAYAIVITVQKNVLGYDSGFIKSTL